MSTPFALLRLTWRPLTLLLLPFMPVVFIMVFDQGDASFNDILRGDSSWPVRDALWHLVVLGPLPVGYLAAMYRLELQHATMSFTLPGVQRGLVAGTLALGLPVAAALALLTVRIAPVGVAFAAFALALFWFLLPGAILDAALPRSARLLAGIVLVGGWASSGDVGVDHSAQGWLGPIVEAHPMLTALLALGCVAALLKLQTSQHLARQRPLRWSSLSSSAARPLYWAQQRPSSQRWRTSLASERAAPWLRAAAYESDAFVRAHLWVPVFAVMFAMIMGTPSSLWLLGGLVFTQQGLQLSPGMVYPLSRSRRARLAWFGTVTGAALFCMVAGAVLFVATRLPLADLRIPLLVPDDASAFDRWPTVLAIAFAFAPMAQWPVIRWSATSAQRATHLVGRVTFLLAYMIVCAMTAEVLSGGRFAGNARAVAAAVLALVLMVQLIHWHAVRSYFTTADLVR